MEQNIVGRFAPTPSGRMHLGNVFAALMAYLAAKSRGGTVLLRIEDLDAQRTKPEYTEILLDDLNWLGLSFDGQTQPQSQRSHIYQKYLDILHDKDLLYPCYCTRAQLHSVNAPHQSDGTYIYPGTCRNLTETEKAAFQRAPAWRLKVPDRTIHVHDLLQGDYSENLARDCGDFILCRGDGAFVYQLAVTVDDGESGVNQVVRGVDLLSSCPRQMYLQELLGFPQPEYGHIPLLVAPDGRRLSKRDKDMDLGFLRGRFTAPEILGILAQASGLIDRPEPVSARELIGEFSWKKVGKHPICLNIHSFLQKR